jgi:two-component system cell cycle response regulator
MQTGSDSPDQIKEGIDAGVFYYLTKPIAEEVLRSVVSSAVKESKQKKLLRAELSGFVSLPPMNTQIEFSYNK